MKQHVIEKLLEAITIGMTTCIAGHVVTRWSRESFEIGTWGKSFMPFVDAVTFLCQPNP